MNRSVVQSGLFGLGSTYTEEFAGTGSPLVQKLNSSYETWTSQMSSSSILGVGKYLI